MSEERPSMEALSALARRISKECEADLERHGDTHLGAGWTRGPHEAATRYRIMLGAVREALDQVKILDFGCGCAHLLDYALAAGHEDLRYAGLDLSPSYLAVARNKHPNVEFLEVDVLEDPEPLKRFDYVLMNGVFHWKGSASYEEMHGYWKELLRTVYQGAKRGLAFNVMSKLVDWERDELFHLPVESAVDFIGHSITRNFVVHHGYGLHEYTVYAYREPAA